MLTAAALNGAFQGRVDQVVNVVNAPLLAAERGITVVEERFRASRDYTNTVEVRVEEAGETVTVSGTTIGPEPRLFLAGALGFAIDIGVLGAGLMPTVDLAASKLRDLNAALHALRPNSNEAHWRVLNPRGQHAIAVGLDAPVTVEVEGSVGYYCAGMNKQATVIVNGSAGQGLAENMMSGHVHVKGDASSAAGATACGGLLVIDGNASARCGISLRGLDIVVKGNVGHMSGFMAQAGNIVVLGDAGESLGDSIYEAHIYVRGKVKSLGTDCVEKEMREEHRDELRELLRAAGIADAVKPEEFRRYGSARQLYNFHVDNASAY
mgnify:CR=1 FL=1